MRRSLSFAAVLVSTAWAMQACDSTASPLPDQAQIVQYVPQPNCREFNATVMIGGQPQPAYGQACQQPDGTWQITQNTPGSPPQVYTVPPQAIYVAPEEDAYYWADPYDPPFFVGGSIVFADRFHHFHDGFGVHERFGHEGFGHEGFHGGFAHGGFHGGDHR
jgi:surface antigen